MAQPCEPGAGQPTRAATHRCCACGEIVRLQADLLQLPLVPGTCLCGQETVFSKLGQHLPMWVVYNHPKDFPEGFIARLHLAVDGRTLPTAAVQRAGTLAELRDLLPRGLVRIARNPQDDPVILETWL
jgi:hypothetical protein